KVPARPPEGSRCQVLAVGSYAAATLTALRMAPSFARVVATPKTSIFLPVHTLEALPASTTMGEAGRRRQVPASLGADAASAAVGASARVTTRTKRNRSLLHNLNILRPVSLAEA